ncbi:MAG: tetratricopeptide repeat protein, partial [Clostridiales bacterium]|nr:tetratricopeptide repeat protein [Clostridiales bacterium]
GAPKTDTKLDRPKKPIYKMGENVNKKSRISPKAPVLPPFQEKEDRIKKYLKKYLKLFVFDELSPEYIKRAGIDFMKGVPIPLRKEDLEAFKSGEGLKPNRIADNIVWVMGIDPEFKYVPQYVEYMNQNFTYRILEGILKKGRDLAEKGEYDHATIYFRAILVLKPDYLHAMYSYARVCREQYLNSHNEELIGRYKAESIEYFELLTEVHPKFAQAYYYLGYAYLNMGLYQKACFVWEEFLRRSMHRKDKNEIRHRIQQIQEPVQIEKGYTAVLAGRWHEGIEILEPFTNSRFHDWWPLSYYLGVAYCRTHKKDKAIECFKKALRLNPSHVESMLELADIYKEIEDKENETKYRKKAELILKREND